MNAIKVTTPDDMDSIDEEVLTWVKNFERLFKNEIPNKDYYHLVDAGFLSEGAKRKIEKIYIDAGWKKAKCMNSGDNGERPGLVGLQLWR